MSTKTKDRRHGMSLSWLSLTAAFVLLALKLSSSAALADDPSRILKAMYDYIGAQKNISMSFDTDVEIVTPSMQKLQFSSSGQVLLSRPDKFRATRTGGYADVELVFDGKMLSIAGKNLNVFARRELPGSIDRMVGKLRDDGLDLPGADLLLAGGYEEMTGGRTVEFQQIGRGVIDGVECDHLAFRSDDVDWQLWIELGARPIPRKYVITSKSVIGAPQYTIRVKDWKTDATVAADSFTFKPEADMKKVDLAAIENIDEIPQGTANQQTTGSGARK
jgi:hypothetical protein